MIVKIIKALSLLAALSILAVLGAIGMGHMVARVPDKLHQEKVSDQEKKEDATDGAQRPVTTGPIGMEKTETTPEVVTFEPDQIQERIVDKEGKEGFPKESLAGENRRDYSRSHFPSKFSGKKSLSVPEPPEQDPVETPGPKATTPFSPRKPGSEYLLGEAETFKARKKPPLLLEELEENHWTSLREAEEAIDRANNMLNE